MKPTTSSKWATKQKPWKLEMINIGFLTTIGTNVGDDFIRNGIRAILDCSGVDYCPFYVNKHDPASIAKLCEDEHWRVKDKFRECDLFIQAGAPVYWNLPNGSSSVTSEWWNWMWQDRLFATDQETGPTFVNLGAGSCQPWGYGAETFWSSEACAQFARDAGRRAQVTTVRDPLAKAILDGLDVRSKAMPCPAFLAGMGFAAVRPRPGVIGVNLMSKGSHYDLDGDFPESAWQEECRRLLEGLRKIARVWLIAHDRKEAEFLSSYAEAGEPVFLSSAWRDYLNVYGACSLVVANRVHGAVAASGFGVPAIIIGNDTRAQIGEFMGLPRFRSGYSSAEEILGASEALLKHRDEECERLLALRTATIADYQRLLAPALALSRIKQESRKARPCPSAVSISIETDRENLSPALEWTGGWYDKESEGENWWRWMERWAEIEIHGPEDGEYSIFGQSLALGKGEVQWQVGTGETGSFSAGRGTFAEIPEWKFRLPAGVHRLRLFWTGKIRTPKKDSRRLGVAWRNLEIKLTHPSLAPAE
jgi:hypothetical protein